MAGPVLVSLTRSWVRPPTVAFWVAEVSTVAVTGMGLTHPTITMTTAAASPQTFIPPVP